MIDLQPTHLSNEWVRLIPLQLGHFEPLYAVAADPLLWEQHPERDRYQRDVFERFFAKALISGSAFLVVDAVTNEAIGSSRYYDYDEAAKHIAIGYTFLARSRWGNTYNSAMKQLMLDYIFPYVDAVIFHVGQNNIRSQKVVQKLGAVKVGEETRELTGASYIYRLERSVWQSK
jgi:RimJ/RimL family protein N-acetyltransferase